MFFVKEGSPLIVKTNTNLGDTSANNNNDDSNPCNSELELKKLEDRFVQVTPPFNSFNNTGEVVIL